MDLNGVPIQLEIERSVGCEGPSRYKLYYQWQLISIEAPEVCGGRYLSVPVSKHSRQCRSTGNFIKTNLLKTSYGSRHAIVVVRALFHPLARAFSAASIHLESPLLSGSEWACH